MVRRVTNQKAAILSETQALWEGKLPWTLGQTRRTDSPCNTGNTGGLLKAFTPSLLEIPLEIPLEILEGMATTRTSMSSISMKLHHVHAKSYSHV